MKFKAVYFIIICALLICSCKSTKKTAQGDFPDLPEVTSNTEITVRTESVKPVDLSERNIYRFYVIIGSFRSIDNARQYNNELVSEGFAPVILESENGLFRISVSGYNEENDARAKIAEIRANYENHGDVWLLVSK